MANNALALYCLHMFMQAPVFALLKELGAAPNPITVCSAIVLTIVLSYLCAQVLSVVLRDKVLT